MDNGITFLNTKIYRWENLWMFHEMNPHCPQANDLSTNAPRMSTGYPVDTHRLLLTASPNGTLVLDASDEILNCRFQRRIRSSSCFNSLAGVHDRRVVSPTELQADFGS